ncbi:MAG: hypothetical protein IT320_12320 [Anaerolineae bacterium]|nr:hypothetical protein [Anaerolineae bacterium]
MTTWLAFDIGTTGAKAALIDAQGRVIRSAFRGYPTHSAAGGVVEQSARDWWGAACASAREIDASSAEAVVLTGQMQDVILVDQDAQPVYPVILYSDTRAHTETEAIHRELGAERLQEVTGNEQGAGSLLAKLRWLSRFEPGTLTRAVHLLTGAADYIALQLTNKAACDTTTVSTTGLMVLDTRHWLTEAGMEAITRLYPDLVPGGTLIGQVHQIGALTMGITAGIPVYLGPGDAGATTLGVGAGMPGVPYGYIGTSGWVAFTSSQRGDPAKGVFTLAHPTNDRTICVAPLLTAGGNLDWIKSVLAEDTHADLIQAALAQPASDLIYLPYLNGERSPISDPFARGAFIGLSAAHTRADLARAVLEGVAFAYRHALDTLIDTPITRLVMTGGGTRSLGWCQMIADVCGVEVALDEDASNVGVRGALLAAQVARGDLPDYALPERDSQATALTPNDALHASYGRKYAWFREGYPALKGLFARMANENE